MTYYSRHLPHWHPEATWLFVTWRLAGSLPFSPDLLMLKRPAPQNPGAVFAGFDRQIDHASHGPKWLADPRVARIVVEILRAGERERGFYHLRAWVIMPNHVHVLWNPLAPMSRITRWVKGSTARKANVVLGRTGEIFWQGESYDHWVRNQDELEKIVRYVESNPVTAGLAGAPEHWPWSSASAAGETACPTEFS
jgi:REP element-mobilizing transposase RayT